MWKDIPDYKELYQGSEDGEIRNKKTGRILKPNEVANGYLQVKLCKNRLYKQHLVHKLILETFIGPCPFGMECCHNNGNKRNNFVGNLRYDTHKNNCKDQIKHGTINCGSKIWSVKLKNVDIIKIRQLDEEGVLTQNEIGKLFDISQGHVTKIINRKIWKHIK